MPFRDGNLPAFRVLKKERRCHLRNWLPRKSLYVPCSTASENSRKSSHRFLPNTQAISNRPGQEFEFKARSSPDFQTRSVQRHQTQTGHALVCQIGPKQRVLQEHLATRFSHCCFRLILTNSSGSLNSSLPTSDSRGALLRSEVDQNLFWSFIGRISKTNLVFPFYSHTRCRASHGLPSLGEAPTFPIDTFPTEISRRQEIFLYINRTLGHF